MEPLFAELEALMSSEIYGRVVSVQGLLVEVAGPVHEMSVGAVLAVARASGLNIPSGCTFGLCGTCWRDTAFIGGTVCDACGLPLPGGGDVGTRPRG